MAFQLQVLSFLAAVLIAFYLPGNALLASLRPSPRKAAGLQKIFDIEHVFFSLALGIVTTGFTGQILAASGIFNLPLLLTIVYGFTGIVLFLRRKTVEWQDLRNGFEPLITIFGLWLFIYFLGKPYEWIAAGGWDAGNYNNIAAQMVHTGGVLDTDLPHVLFNDFIGPNQWQPTISNLYLPSEGIVYPRYFHLFSVYLAIFDSFGGTYLSQYVNALFGLAALISFYLILGQLEVSRLTAVLGTLLLALTGIEYHYFREVYSEMCAQYFFWAAMASLTIGFRRNSDFAVLLAASLLGGLFLVKMDAVLTWQLSAAIAMGSLFFCRIDRAFASRMFRFSTALIPLFILTCLYAWGLSRPYTLQISDKIRQSIGLHLTKETFLALYSGALVLALSSVSLVALVLYRFPDGRIGRFIAMIRRRTTSPSAHRVLKALAPAAVGVPAIYLFVLRPLGYAASKAAGAADAYKLISSIRLLYVFAPFTVAVCLVGAGILVARRMDRSRSIPILLPLLSFFYYMIDIAHQNLQVIWTYRRLIPAVVPFIVLCVAVFIDALLVWSKKRTGLSRHLLRWTGASVAILAAALTVFHLKPFWSYTENEGLYDKMQKIASEIPPDAPLLMEPGAPSNQFCSTLRFVFRKQCIVIRKKHLSNVLEKAVQKNGSVLVAQISREQIKEIKKNYHLKNVYKERFKTPWLRGDPALPEDGSLRLLYPNRFIQTERVHRFQMFRVSQKRK